jgi:hypothetical protein
MSPPSEIPLGLGITDDQFREGRAFAHDYARKQGFPDISFVEQSVSGCVSCTRKIIVAQSSDGTTSTRSGETWPASLGVSIPTPHRHLNNTKYATFMEHGRMHLIEHVRNSLTDDEGRRCASTLRPHYRLTDVTGSVWSSRTSASSLLCVGVALSARSD